MIQFFFYLLLVYISEDFNKAKVSIIITFNSYPVDYDTSNFKKVNQRSRNNSSFVILGNFRG